MAQWRFFFIPTSQSAVNIYEKDNFGSDSRSQIILAPPAAQHWFSGRFLDFLDF